MNQKQALARLRKLIGPKAAYRINDRAPTTDEREVIRSTVIEKERKMPAHRQRQEVPRSKHALPRNIFSVSAAMKRRGLFAVLVPPASDELRASFRQAGIELPRTDWELDAQTFLTRKGAESCARNHEAGDPAAGPCRIIEYNADEVIASLRDDATTQQKVPA